MWVVLRLVLALVGFAIRMPWWRRRIGEPAGEYNGIPYWIRNRRSWLKRSKYDHRIGMALQSPTWIRMAYESSFDKLCKRIGIANEQSTGDARFDEDVYVTCDHPFVGALLATSAELRAAVRAALLKSYTVHYDGSFIWLIDDWIDKPREAAPELVDAIRRASAPLQDSELPGRFRDRFLAKAFVVEGFVWAMAAYASGTFIEHVWVGKEFVHASLFWLVMLGLGFAAVLFASLVAIIVWWMRGSSRGHRVIAESLIVLLFALPFAGIQLASDTNRELDTSAPVVREGIARTCEVRPAKGEPIYLLHMQRVEPPVRDEIKVAKQICESVMRGTPVRFTVGAGFWGLDWYRRIETPSAVWTPGRSRW